VLLRDKFLFKNITNIGMTLPSHRKKVILRPKDMIYGPAYLREKVILPTYQELFYQHILGVVTRWISEVIPLYFLVIYFLLWSSLVSRAIYVCCT